MNITSYPNVAALANPHGVDARKLYDTEHAQVVHLTLKPGESLKKHVTPVDVVFYVLRGTGVVEIGDEEVEVMADACIDSPARIPHRWRNTGNSDLRLLVTKVPRPQEKTRVL